MRAAAAAASTSASVAFGFAKRRFSRTDAADRDAAPDDVVETRREIAERRLPRPGLADESRRRAGRYSEADVLQRPVVAVAEPDVVEDGVARRGDLDRVRTLLDVHSL